MIDKPKNNFANNMPLGFSMALAQNSAAMTNFSGMAPDIQQQTMDTAKNIHSKSEMQDYVQQIAKGQVM